MRTRGGRAFCLAGAAACLLASAFAFGSGTRSWEIAGFDELERGTLDGTAVSNRGEVGLGLRARRLDVGEVGLVWSAARDREGRQYLGTGYDGLILRLDGERKVEVATTSQLVVTAMAFDKAGNLYAAALPDPVILRVPSPDKAAAGKPVVAEKWAVLPEGTKHVFSLAFDKDGRTLYAGTGPEGKVFAIGPDGKPEVYVDTAEEHVLALAFAKDGALLLGTSPGAQLLKATGPGRAVALADFESTEVKAIAVQGDDVIVAVNLFKRPPAMPTKPNPNPGSGPPDMGGSADSRGPREAGDGEIYRIGPTGRQDKLWERKKGHVVCLALAGGGLIFAGLGAEGKVVSIAPDRIVRTELDLDERQVMALVAGRDLELATTGDAGAVYAVAKARAADAVYLTPPLDAKSVSHWGRIHWFARGKLQVESRSGNTITPGTGWSEWSKPLTDGDLVGSPPARFIQLRVSFAKDEKASLVSAELAYRPANAKAVITELDPGSPYPKPKPPATSETGDNQTSTRTMAVMPTKRNNAELVLTWKVDNPDEDALRYRLWYRAVGEDLWRPILREDEVLKATRYTWDTESVPEGRYQIRLAADDTPDNDARAALSDEYLSVPVLVDNHQPSVKGLELQKGHVNGTAEDGFSPIAGLEFAVDAGPWMPVFSVDGVFDERKEEFSFDLPVEVKPGPHAVAVRASDRAGNLGSAELHVEIPK